MTAGDQPKRMLVSIIVPCWNEEEMVPLFHAETSAAIADCPADFEFLFIDDGSTDGTARALAALAESDPRVRVLRFSRNFGSFAAVTAGLHHCRGDAAVCLAADLQDPPSLIPRLIDEWRAGHDVVWAAIDGRGDSFAQSLFSRLFYGLIRRLALGNMPPQGMNMGLFSRRVIDIYKALPERDTIPFFTILKLGFPQAQVPYFRQPRRAGTTGWSFWKRVRSAVDVIVTFSYAPVRFISALGAVAAALGLGYAAVIVFEALVRGITVPGWSSLMVVVLLASGIQLLTLGFIAEYLWRQSRQVRAEPRYIVMEELGTGGGAPANPVTDPNNINVAVPAAAGDEAE